MRGVRAQHRSVVRDPAYQSAIARRHLGRHNHQPHPRPSGRLITVFTLQLNANPPFAGSTFGRFTSTFCNHTRLAGFYVSSTGAPAVSMESMACTDGDFGLIVETLSATTAEGRCSLGGPDCRFSMTRR